MKILILFCTLILGAAAVSAATCDSLASLALPDATVTSAQTVAPGAFKQPGGGRETVEDAAGPTFKDLPAFCRVTATLKPSSDSDIKIEVWLPASGWNQKYQAVGNGGWAGAISYAAMANAIRGGYATSSTDTGHVGGRGTFALGHPEKLVDFGYRAVHEMTVKAKTVIAAYYGSAPKISYWNGCSTGGRQGLKEVQRFADDFDGVIAGAQANPRTGVAFEGMWLAMATLKDPASNLPKSKYSLIHNAVIEACDAKDGLKDGLIDDPRKCTWDPKVLECKGADGPTCLTTAQVEAVRKIYTPATNPRTGKAIFGALQRGSELGWATQAGGPEPNNLSLDQFKYVVFKDPNWDWRTLNLDSDYERAVNVDDGLIDATDPNLSAFLGHKGKLLMYHGWADQMVSPMSSINYYQSVIQKMGKAKVADSVRLFMVPGMAHCRGGEGTDKFDMVSVMEQWVEKGKAPTSILASRVTNGKVERTRPLCSYPQVAAYKGSGSIDDAANFSCKVP
jgi:feruloyl esterase